MSKSKTWFTNLGVGGKIGVIIAGIFVVGTVSAAVAGPTPAKPHTPPQSKPTTYTKTVTTNVDVPFTSSTVQDASLAQGTTKVTTAGVNGSKTQTWLVTYTNGREVKRILVSAVVSTAPVNEVVDQGTMVSAPAPAASTPACTNGTYVNSAGNTVCSPESSSTQPAGATAQCVDGTYSFSQSRSGTCSHHGGVATWL